MNTIAEALERFRAGMGACNPRLTASPASIIDLSGKCLDDYGYEDLNEFDGARFQQEYNTAKRFCEIFGADHVRPLHCCTASRQVAAITGVWVHDRISARQFSEHRAAARWHTRAGVRRLAPAARTRRTHPA